MLTFLALCPGNGRTATSSSSSLAGAQQLVQPPAPMQHTKVLSEEVIYQRYITVYNRRVQFSSPSAAEVRRCSSWQQLGCRWGAAGASLHRPVANLQPIAFYSTRAACNSMRRACREQKPALCVQQQQGCYKGSSCDL